MNSNPRLKARWKEIVRTAAFFAPLATFILILSTVGKISFSLVMGLLSVSCSMVLLSPSGTCPVKLTCRVMVLQALLCLLSPVLLLFLSRELVAVCLNMVAVIPMLVMLILYLSGLIHDVDFLTESLVGWEYMLGVSKIFYSVLYLSVLCLFYSACLLHGALAIVLKSVCVGGMVFLVALLHCRLLTKNSILASHLESGILKTAGPVALLKPMPGKMNLNYKIVYNRMCEFMTDKKPFLADSYSLDELAKSLYTNKSYLSKMVNACTGMNFSQFMNNYRVQYAMELFKKDTRLRVSELAMMSGFKSGVTFNLAFKLFLNQNPSEWCNDYRNSTIRNEPK